MSVHQSAEATSINKVLALNLAQHMAAKELTQMALASTVGDAV